MKADVGSEKYICHYSNCRFCTLVFLIIILLGNSCSWVSSFIISGPINYEDLDESPKYQIKWPYIYIEFGFTKVSDLWGEITVKKHDNAIVFKGKYTTLEEPFIRKFDLRKMGFEVGKLDGVKCYWNDSTGMHLLESGDIRGPLSD
jgi:hypothetical protein